MAARSKAWLCGRSVAGIARSNPARGHGYLSLVSVVSCQVGVSASGSSCLQWSPTECGASGCDRAASIIRKPCPTRGCSAMEITKVLCICNADPNCFLRIINS